MEERNLGTIRGKIPNKAYTIVKDLAIELPDRRVPLR